MIISPPFLPETGVSAPSAAIVDPMMDAADKLELAHGIYPVAMDRRWHTGAHLAPSLLNERVRAIADGEVIAYRVCQHAIEGSPGSADSSAGFVLLKHTTETGDGRVLTFYSLYMHLLEFDRFNDYGTPLSALPSFLQACSPGPDTHPPTAPPAQPGKGLKVHRKDVLGLTGTCHGQRHLHFEIFMTRSDFNAYFGATQLGKAQLTTPTKPDCWGSTYYVISGEYSFYRVPVDQAMTRDNQLHGIAFSAKTDGRLPANHTLYVEVYFHLGQRYTRSWLDKGDGHPVLITRSPVADSTVDYEYDLYKRATALYPACPSDGYEMLRFGRILSTPATLQDPANRATWISVVFDEAGTQGYVNVADNAIQKLSDADFPFFTGWKRLSEDQAPFDADGLCDIDSLKRLLGDANAEAAGAANNAPATATRNVREEEERLIAYVKSHTDVRKQLRGLVCEAPSEWDSSNHEARYARLKQAGEFYENNPKGYAQFMRLLDQFQFWGSTGLPAGEKLWFFHPLEFIRHFRKCGWFSLREQIQLLPRRSMPAAGGLISWDLSKARFTAGANSEGGSAPPRMGAALNGTLRKYGFNSSLRKAHFFGQVFKETGALRSTVEIGDVTYFTKMYERYTPEDAASDFDRKRDWLARLGFLKNRDRSTYIAQRPHEIHAKAVSNGNVQLGDGPRFCGRGLIHLTWRNNYQAYGRYRAKDFTTDPNPTLLQSDSDVVSDSAGYFWAMAGISRKADHGPSNLDVQACFRLVGGAGGLLERQQFFRFTYFILNDQPNMPADAGLARQTESEQ
ncbi:putative kinase [Caballeronia sordidicola]|uniref:Putative kinase n=1 Tax=Caballeronia sordidicola TaxID=196367 RepID=A0A242MIH3_CABSO|nr:hypothetical protein AXG89_37755 [Burkholderia sp. PAMC 26561]OTP71108.1 putative kinase [Caballeronia sordidicola]